MDALLADLNPAQREAVAHVEGPLLVLAGPGSGKTRVITRRIAHLVAQGVRPWQILAITFTNKAAKEMRERVAALIPPRGITLSTFHALGARLLREFAVQARLGKDFVIFDVPDRRSMIKTVLDELDIKDEEFTPARIEQEISKAKDRLLTPERMLEAADGWRGRTLANVWRAYEAAMRKANALDFDDLLCRLVFLLRDDKSVRERLNDRYRFILIDEYQDTNHAQYELTRLLAGPRRGPTHGSTSEPNLCVTGDPDQSIYAWRGADISNILSFERDYPTAKVIRLEENYRSTPQILAVADAIIAQNTQRKAKRLYTSNAGGMKVRCHAAADEQAEALTVADHIAAIHRRGGELDEVAIFYRTNSLSRPLEEALLRARIPYRIARGVEFYNRKEVRDVLAYLRLLLNPHDIVSFARVVNVPSRKIGKTTVDRVIRIVQTGAELPAVLEQPLRWPEVKSAAKRLSEFGDLLTNLRNEFGLSPAGADGFDFGGGTDPGSTQAVAPLITRVLDASGLRDELAHDDPERLENVEQLVNSAAEYDASFNDEPAQANDSVESTHTDQTMGRTQRRGDDGDANEAIPFDIDDGLSGPSLADWLAGIALVADADHTEGSDVASGSVTLMTLHAAKGLEFDHVVLVGLEDGLLPHRRAEEEGKNGLEEERRLFFVGITRARKELMLTRACRRMHNGQFMPSAPSLFIRELPDEHVQHTGEVSSFAPRRRSFGTDFNHTPEWAEKMLQELRSGNLRPPTPSGFRRDVYVEGIDEQPEFHEGDAVIHQRYGNGQIETLRRDSGVVRATVRFDQAGTKQLVLPHSALRHAQ